MISIEPCSDWIFRRRAASAIGLRNGDEIRIQASVDAGLEHVLAERGWVAGVSACRFVLGNPGRVLAGLPAGALAAFAAGMLMNVAALPVRVFWPWALALVIAATWAAMCQLRPVEAVVGTDGALLRFPFRTRYVAFHDRGRVAAQAADDQPAGRR